MKDRRYANRGQPFEEFIRFANGIYAKKGIAIIDKMPTEFIPIRNNNGVVVSVKVERKSKVDFIGRYKEYPIAIEAKHTSEDSISFDRVEAHQAEYMDAFTAQAGTIGLVLISFGLKRYFAVPWKFWSEARRIRHEKGDKKSFKAVSAFDEEWIIPNKKSVRIEDLSPLWEVSTSTANQLNYYGLPYLKNAEKYVVKDSKGTEKTV